MPVVYANAMLTEITAVGSSDDYDQAAAPGAARWTGGVGITVRERLVEVLSADRVDELKETHLELPYAVGRLVVRGDTLTYIWEDATVARAAGSIIHAKLAGRVRVSLENA